MHLYFLRLLVVLLLFVHGQNCTASVIDDILRLSVRTTGKVGKAQSDDLFNSYLKQGKIDEAAERAKQLGDESLYQAIKQNGRIIGKVYEFYSHLDGVPDWRKAESLYDEICAHLGREDALAKRMAASLEASYRLEKSSIELDILGQNFESLGKRIEIPKFTNDQVRLLKNVSDCNPSARIHVVDAKVKRFASEFLHGAKSYDEVFRAGRISHPEIINPWLSARRCDRVFIIGSSEDSAEIARLTKSLKADGKEVFFYKFATDSAGALPPTELVGACFRSSGSAMVFRKSLDVRSRYIPIEIEVARRLLTDQAELIIFKPSELITAASGTSAVVGIGVSYNLD